MKRVPTTRAQKVLFAFKPAKNTPDKIPVLVFLLPEASWEYMQGGLGHDFDLTNLGIPLKILIGRTATEATGMDELRRAGLIDDATKDLREADVSFEGKTKQ